MRRSFIPSLLVLALVVGCGDGSTPAGASCEPACSSGYACNFGVCTPACNPPCGALEQCIVRSGASACVSTDASAPPWDIVTDLATNDTPTPPDDASPPGDGALSDTIAPSDTTAPEDAPAPSDTTAPEDNAPITDTPAPIDRPDAGSMDVPRDMTAPMDTTTVTDRGPVTDAPADRGTTTDTPVDRGPGTDVPRDTGPMDAGPPPCGREGQPCCFDVCAAGLRCLADRCQRYTLDTGECFHDSQCPAGRVCAGPQFCTGGRSCFRCTEALSSATGRDTTCMTYTSCATGLCINGRCTASCRYGTTGDTECQTFAANHVCAQTIFGVPPFDAGTAAAWETRGACVPSCARNADCTNGRVCVVNGDYVGDRTRFICSTTTRMGAAGARCTSFRDCQSGLCVNGAFADGTSACTAPCVNNADCPAAAPRCTFIDYYTPNGVPFTGRGCLPAT